jgi:hypothetical protein
LLWFDISLVKRKLILVAEGVCHYIIHTNCAGVTYTLPLRLLVHIQENSLSIGAVGAVWTVADEAVWAAPLEILYLTIAV